MWIASITGLVINWLVLSTVMVVIVVTGRAMLNSLNRKREIERWTVEENAERQWLFLKHLCELANGSTRNGVSPKRMRQTLGWHSQEVRAVRADLEDAQLVERRESRWATMVIKIIDSLGDKETKPEPGIFVDERLHITARGVEKVRANRAPGIPALNISGQGHQVMVNSPGGYQSAQHTFNASDLTHVLQEYRRALQAGGLDTDAATQARRYLVVVDSEIRKPVPDERVLRRILGILYQIALGAAGNAAWAGVITLLQRLLWQ